MAIGDPNQLQQQQQQQSQQATLPQQPQSQQAQPQQPPQQPILQGGLPQPPPPQGGYYYYQPNLGPISNNQSAFGFQSSNIRPLPGGTQQMATIQVCDFSV